MSDDFDAEMSRNFSYRGTGWLIDRPRKAGKRFSQENVFKDIYRIRKFRRPAISGTEPRRRDRVDGVPRRRNLLKTPFLQVLAGHRSMTLR